MALGFELINFFEVLERPQIDDFIFAAGSDPLVVGVEAHSVDGFGVSSPGFDKLFLLKVP